MTGHLIAMLSTCAIDQSPTDAANQTETGDDEREQVVLVDEYPIGDKGSRHNDQQEQND